MSYDNLYQQALTYEVSLTNITYVRTVYSWIDLLSAVGGIIQLLNMVAFWLSQFAY